MGGGVYTRLAKGRVFKKLDDIIAQLDQTVLKTELGTKPVLSDLGIGRNIIQSTDKPHADDEWFGDFNTQNAWWPWFEGKESIVREGYVLAYEKAAEGSNPPLPIVTYWLNGGEHFEVVVTRSPYQVSVFLVTPLPPKMHYVGNEYDEDIWIVSNTDRVEEVKAQHRQPTQVTTGPTNEAGVRWLRVRGY